MDKVDISVTVSALFEDPFWILLIERHYGRNKYDVCKITMGAEPKDYEVYAFLMENFDKLTFGAVTTAPKTSVEHKNPKTLQRKVAKQIEKSAQIGTKAQIAIKATQEEDKIQRKIKTKEEKLAEEQQKYEQRRQKQKEKHRGK